MLRFGLGVKRRDTAAVGSLVETGKSPTEEKRKDTERVEGPAFSILDLAPWPMLSISIWTESLRNNKYER